MTDALVLDSLLGLIVLLSMPIGFWRGAAREVFASTGILLGVAVAAAWEDRWGRNVADFLSLSASNARFLTATALVLVAMLIIGYGGAALAGSGSGVGLVGRLAGAWIAAANAIVLLSWSLAVIARDVADARALEAMEDGQVARRLLHDEEWVLLGIAGAALLAVLTGITVNAFTRNGTLPAIDGSAPVSRGGSQSNRLRPVRFPRDADTGKFEPASRQFDPRTGRFGADAAGLSPSMPLTGVDRARWSTDTSGSVGLPAWVPRHDGNDAPRNGLFSGREWLRRTDQQGRDTTGTTEPRERPGRRRSEIDRCGACGAPITAEDAYCPRCGTGTSQ